MDIKTSFFLLSAAAFQDWDAAVEIVGTEPAIENIRRQDGDVAADAVSSIVSSIDTDRAVSHLDADAIRPMVRRAYDGEVKLAVDVIAGIVARAAGRAMVDQALSEMRSISVPPYDAPHHVVQTSRDRKDWYDEAAFRSAAQADAYIALRRAAVRAGERLHVRCRPYKYD